MLKVCVTSLDQFILLGENNADFADTLSVFSTA